MRKPVFLLLARVLLGIIFLLAGINGFFVIFDLKPFMPTSPKAMALFQFRYLLIFEKSAEVFCGVLLLINRFVPLALAILSPIIANIFLLHLFVDHSLLPVAALLVIILVFLLIVYRKNFEAIFEKKPI